MPMISLDDLLATLELTTTPEGFRAPSLDLPHGAVFGGQLLAQTVVGAARSAPDKHVQSFSVRFPREGRAAELAFTVDAAQDGRSFSTRRLQAAQEGKTFFVADVTLDSPEASTLEHQASAPNVGDPADATEVDLGLVPWETRMVDGVDLEDRSEGPAQLRWWTRAAAFTDADPALHQALLAHATDLTLIGTALRPFPGIGQADAHVTIQTAVTAHSMWFHRPIRIDDWLLVDQHVPVVAGARGFGLGHVFDAAGVLVASFAQESLIRPPAPEA